MDRIWSAPAARVVRCGARQNLSDEAVTQQKPSGRIARRPCALLAQIIGLVYAYDAVTSDRPYQRGQSPTEAIRVLGEQAERTA
jgi:hypothetical protein